MFLLKTPPKKKTVLVIITLLSVLVIFVELARYQYDGLHIGSDIFQWASKEELDHATDVNKESSNARSSSSRFMDNNQPAPIQHTPSSEEKYLTYLPYSRFSNQRSTLVNAALLAKYLNRTLIVPPMFLGSANGWSPAPGLYRVLANMTDSSFQDRCFDSNGQPILEEPVVPPEGEEVEFGCYNFTTYVMVPWSWATDLHRLTLPEEDGGLSIRIMERSDMSLGALQRQLGLLDDDMFLMQDDTRYQWHIYDSKDQVPNPRYKYEISMNELRGISERLLHFYGIFGYDRLMLQSPESVEFRLRIEQALIFRHPAIAEASAIILEQLLDGVDKTEDELVPLDPVQAQEKEQVEQDAYELPRFVAAHIRAGDGVFLRKLKDRVPEFVHQIWDIMTGNETTRDDLIGASNKIDANAPAAPPRNLYPLPTAPEHLRNTLGKLDIKERLTECKKRKQMVLYVATDAPNPRSNVELQPILDAFPCTFFMSDFGDSWRVPLSKVRSPLDAHKDLTEHLVMFVDATVCSWAERFVGTRTSTFSNYIKQYRHAIVDDMIEHQTFDA